MGKHRGCYASHLLLLPLVAAVALVTCSTAAAQKAEVVEVKLTFQGLSQTIFDQKYANATLEAVAAAAGMPVEYVTRTDASFTKSQSTVAAAASVLPTAFIPTATASRTASPAAGNNSNTAADSSSKGTAMPAASFTASGSADNRLQKNSSSHADGTVTNTTGDSQAGSSSTMSTTAAAVSTGLERPVKALASKITYAPTTGSRKLLGSAVHRGLRQLSPGSDAQATYTIQTGPEEWETQQAIKEKLAAAVEAPENTFQSILAHRGVPYAPTVSVDGRMLTQGRPALSDPSSNPADGVVDISTIHVKTAPRDQSDMKMIGMFPLWVFIPLVVLAALLVIAALVALGVLSWHGISACKACCSEDFKETSRQEQFITGGPQEGQGLIKQPGGGYAPTQGALEKLNASFPTKTGSARAPESVISNQTALSLHTNATTARSTAGLLATADGKRQGGRNGSSVIAINAEQASLEYYRAYAQQGKAVPVLPHSKIVKPGPAAIKVPVVARSGTTAANAGSVKAAQQDPAPHAAPQQNPAPQAAPQQNPAPQAAAQHNPAPQAAPQQDPAPQAAAQHNPAPQAAPQQNPAPQAAAQHNPAPQAAAFSAAVQAADQQRDVERKYDAEKSDQDRTK